ncbi:MAG: dimethylsulfonioproprionate lyase family protein [Rhizobiaceae bacterium]|nr:dimethylsulfonioproprionate lyase family protein [Rhizobiaceae bacterium]
MSLEKLFIALVDVLDGDLDIERAGRDALLKASDKAELSASGHHLPDEYLDIFEEPDAHPVCDLIANTQFEWAPPTTSDDPKYIADSTAKAHVELIGPDGLVKSNQIRMGLYGMLAGHEYGIRTHLAEEVFVMLAGEADWKTGTAEYKPLRAGARSWHPSMKPHANRTRHSAFMSVYIWQGDVSTQSYFYQGR